MGDGSTGNVIITKVAQFKIEGFRATGSCKRSDPFKFGLWNWRLSAKRTSMKQACIGLSLEPSEFSENHPPSARFILRVTTRESRYSRISSVYERVLRASDEVTWDVEIFHSTYFVIGVEFLDLEISPPNVVGEEVKSTLPSVDKLQHIATRSSSRSVYRMLNESINADITIFALDGKLQAHKAILSASSPVFYSMFALDLKEKQTSTIEMEDMTTESCMALLRFLYGCIEHEEFWKHRVGLLGAANKYDITDLKDACEESLLEDIDAENVLDRLQEAWLYKLGKLKKGCFGYLLDFGKINDVSREKMSDFSTKADRELVMEMFEMMAANIAPLGSNLFLTEATSNLDTEAKSEPTPLFPLETDSDSHSGSGSHSSSDSGSRHNDSDSGSRHNDSDSDSHSDSP